MLEANAHDAFDDFCWCLKPTDVKNVYAIHEFQPGAFFPLIRKTHITFVDHSYKQTAGPSAQVHSKQSHAAMEIPLPSCELLCLHAALAGVLHLSGAGTLLCFLRDELGAGGHAVQSLDGQSFMKQLIEDELYEAVSGLEHFRA
ncbi:uncharacterized protein B0H18DRAFT_1150013 [Fomitopsis serialis]|uniref:uncharacterized protein n=1 Tax=Fomitopsis serialis TaxID=139415 RepID=UPI0020072835|nr:uncharacterized protein B0H18DRAFT_1150013 [Neoantrodia serialis]KAH9936978.1 hypothetical protein B0H18DRAFT_1150013 [Neoantrodia serialis]